MGIQLQSLSAIETVHAYIPEKPLTAQSLKVAPLQGKTYQDWTGDDHTYSFHLLQRIIAIWKRNEVATQYMVYGKITKDLQPFEWEIVPYKEKSNVITRIWQQFVVMLRIIFGGLSLSEEKRQQRLRKEELLFMVEPPSVEVPKNSSPSTDPFCSDAVINRQLVFEGERVQILFNHAPLGLGGERLHFLIVPKQHRPTFASLTHGEYRETTRLVQQMVAYFFKTRPVENIYIFHKTGIDAGHTIKPPHWHTHVVISTKRAQDWLGKLTVLKNMIFGSSPMKEDALRVKVQSLKAEFAAPQ